MDGSWTFTRDGDYLTTTVGAEDISGVLIAYDVVEAVGACCGMDTHLIMGYVNGLSKLDIESENFEIVDDEATGNTTYRINIAGLWDMKGLDDMKIDEASLSFYDSLKDTSISSFGSNIGKVMMVANRSDDGLTLLVGEYGGLDELAYQSVVNIVSTFQPDGWEDFAANYTELADVETEGYSVSLNVDDAAVGEIIDDAHETYSYALIRFGNGSDGGDAYDFEPPAPAEAPDVDAFAMGYFDVIVKMEQGAALAAGDVCAFAEAFELYNPDVEPMRANMLAAFEAMGEDDQARFWENFEAVRALLDDALEDYDANRAVFEDAGVAEAMDEVMYDPLNRLAWRNLRDHTLTMGNDMNVG